MTRQLSSLPWQREKSEKLCDETITLFRQMRKRFSPNIFWFLVSYQYFRWDLSQILLYDQNEPQREKAISQLLNVVRQANPV